MCIYIYMCQKYIYIYMCQNYVYIIYIYICQNIYRFIYMYVYIYVCIYIICGKYVIPVFPFTEFAKWGGISFPTKIGSILFACFFLRKVALETILLKDMKGVFQTTWKNVFQKEAMFFC